MTSKWRFWILPTIVVILIVGGFMFHYFRNRPFAIMGYWTPSSEALQDTGMHFSHDGMLEVDFHYKEPFVNGMEHITYSLVQVGKSKPVLNSISIGLSSSLQQGSWGEFRFPIARYPNNLHLNRGKYIVDLYINGKIVDGETFYVDKDIVVQGG